MFVRKSLAAIALLLVSAAAKSQTANVTLNIQLTNISSISIAPAFQTVTLTYATAANYANGVTVTQPDAMSVFSNNPYSVTVVAGAADLTGPATNTIPVNSVSVTPTTTTVPGTMTLTPRQLQSGTAQTIIASTVGTVGSTFTLAYSTVGAPVANFLKPAGTYTGQLTYTITNP